MALPIGDIGLGSLAVYVAFKESFGFARFMISRRDKTNGKEKRCVDHEGVRLSMQNNVLMAESMKRLEGHMQKVSENSTIQVTLLQQLNGRK